MIRFLLAAVLILPLGGCAHHVRFESIDVLDEPLGDEIEIDTGELLLDIAQTPFGITVEVQRGAFIDQDIQVVQIIDEAVIPWSGAALVQFGLMSWNPVAWVFPRLWTEPERRDHTALRDWALLWNPFIRTGRLIDEETRTHRRVLRVERRHLRHVRLPLAETDVTLTLSVGPLTETIRGETDALGRITVEFDTLPRTYRRMRPITIDAVVSGRGARQAQVF